MFSVEVSLPYDSLDVAQPESHASPKRSTALKTTTRRDGIPITFMGISLLP
jgi:hypothetical protein